MNQIISEKRKALGLTQEEVAEHLGVTTPAVNKWERGVTCPDLALLPVLARLLKTDPNTLLSFEESLTKQEIAQILNEGAEMSMKEGFAPAFSWMMDKTHAYPNCTELLHSTAMVLDGALLMTKLSVEEKESYSAQITALYERVAQCDDPALADKARYLLASRLLTAGRYDEAQEMLDRLPGWDMPDKRLLQAELWEKQGKPDEASTLLERKVLQNVQENLVTLAVLVRYECEAGADGTAERLAAASQAECEAFGLSPYAACLAPVQAATARKDASASLAALSKLLEAVLIPWETSACPLCRHFAKNESTQDISEPFLPMLLNELEYNDEYAFLRDEPGYDRLLRTYWGKCPSSEA